METPPHAVYFTRHSRARGNPGLFTAELAWIPAFAGMTESRRFIRFAEHLPMLSLRAVFFVVDGLIILQLRHYIRREALHRVFDVGVGHGADVEPTEQLRRAGAGA